MRWAGHGEGEKLIQHSGLKTWRKETTRKK